MHRLSLILVAILVVGCGGSASAQRTDAPSTPVHSLEAPVVTAPAEMLDAPTTFEPISLKGKGAKVAKFTIPEEAAAIAQVTYSGASNFAIWTVGADGAEGHLLVNTIGKYRGTVLFDADAGEHSVAFKIEASGSWAITVKPISSAPIWTGASTLKGTGDGVFRVEPPSSGLVTLDLTFKGDGNFAVVAYSPDGSDLLANEIDRFVGQTLLPNGTFLLEVTADGTWTATRG